VFFCVVFVCFVINPGIYEQKRITMKTIKAMILGLSLMTLPAPAAEFCVSTVSELRAALDTAESNNQHDDIRIEIGVYASGGNTFQYNETQGFDLTISGGWIDFFDNDCGIQSPNEPLETILDGSLSTRALYIRTAGSADIEVSSLTFRNGRTTQSGGGLFISRVDNLNSGVVTVANNAFINNEANFGSALQISSADTFHVRNNLIVANNVIVRNTVSVVQNNANGIYFNNNTVIGNTSDDPTESAGVYLTTSGTSNLLVANNIINGNQLEDLDGRNGANASYYLYNNNVDVLVGSVPDVVLGNMNLPNRFESGIFSFTPDAHSPLVNAGRSPCGIVCIFPTPFQNAWNLGDVDLLEHGRIQEGVVDIGAIESSHSRDLIFWDRLLRLNESTA
jgi:hypothetical protein